MAGSIGNVHYLTPAEVAGMRARGDWNVWCRQHVERERDGDQPLLVYETGETFGSNRDITSDVRRAARCRCHPMAEEPSDNCPEHGRF